MPGSSSDSGPIPPSPQSSAADGAPAVRGTVFPLVLAVAAGLSCWNLFGAPFAIVTAVVALVLALRRRQAAGAARARTWVAAALALVALGVGTTVIVGALRGSGQGPVVPGAPMPAAEESSRALDDAERQSAERREVARRELLRQSPAAPEQGEAPATSSGARR